MTNNTSPQTSTGNGRTANEIPATTNVKPSGLVYLLGIPIAIVVFLIIPIGVGIHNLFGGNGYKLDFLGVKTMLPILAMLVGVVLLLLPEGKRGGKVAAWLIIVGAVALWLGPNNVSRIGESIGFGVADAVDPAVAKQKRQEILYTSRILGHIKVVVPAGGTSKKVVNFAGTCLERYEPAEGWPDAYVKNNTGIHPYVDVAGKPFAAIWFKSNKPFDVIVAMRRKASGTCFVS